LISCRVQESTFNSVRFLNRDMAR